MQARADEISIDLCVLLLLLLRLCYLPGGVNDGTTPTTNCYEDEERCVYDRVVSMVDDYTEEQYPNKNNKAQSTGRDLEGRGG
jgi:hypothetical protein